jgi:hypothetical protein
MKLLSLVLCHAAKAWKKQPRERVAAKTQFAIIFEKRFFAAMINSAPHTKLLTLPLPTGFISSFQPARDLLGRPAFREPVVTKIDLTLAQIAAQFTQFDVAKSRGGYMILDRRIVKPRRATASHSLRRSIRGLLLVECQGRWTTFGNIGRLNLMIESAHEIVANDPISRTPLSR